MSKLEEEEEIITQYFKKGKIVKYNKSSQKIQKLVTTSFNLKNQKSQNILLKNGVRDRTILLVNNFSFFGDAPYKKKLYFYFSSNNCTFYWISDLSL